MALTKDFKSTIIARAKRDNKFCEAMLSEAVTELLSGDVDAGKAILRDYINATITFEVKKIQVAMVDANHRPQHNEVGIQYFVLE